MQLENDILVPLPSYNICPYRGAFFSSPREPPRLLNWWLTLYYVKDQRYVKNLGKMSGYFYFFFLFQASSRKNNLRQEDSLISSSYVSYPTVWLSSANTFLKQPNPSLFGPWPFQLHQLHTTATNNLCQSSLNLLPRGVSRA